MLKILKKISLTLFVLVIAIFGIRTYNIYTNKVSAYSNTPIGSNVQAGGRTTPSQVSNGGIVGPTDIQQMTHPTSTKEPYHYDGPTLNATDQKWVKSIFAYYSMEPQLAAISQKPDSSWNDISQIGYPLSFMLGQKLEKNPFTLMEKTIGLQLELSDYLITNTTQPRKPITVYAVEQDSPAWKAGIRPGYTLLKYNSVPAAQVDWGSVMVLLNQQPASFVFGTFNGNAYSVSLVPDTSQSSVELWTVTQNLSILRIKSFSIQTPQRVYSLLAQVAQKTSQRLLIDLRAPCGELQYMQEVAWILNGGRPLELAKVITRNKEPAPLYAHQPKWANNTNIQKWSFLQQPTILVDSVTALSSEILAYHLESSQKGVIVGDTTTGNNYYSQTFPIPQSNYTTTFPTQRIDISGHTLPIKPTKPFDFNNLSQFYVQHGTAP